MGGNQDINHKGHQDTKTTRKKVINTCSDKILIPSGFTFISFSGVLCVLRGG